MAGWAVVPPEGSPAQTLAAACGVHPLTAQLLVNRGVRTPAQARRFLSPSLEQLGDPLALPDMAKGVARLRQAIRGREPIMLFGDADVDGLSATAILYEALQTLGAQVRVKLSNRIEDGYGLSAALAARLSRSATRLVVLIDCGTNQAEEVERLGRAGIDTIIVDHHLPLESPARPLARINPHGIQQEGRELCSAGLAFQVARALLDGVAPQRARAALDLAALATLADYVPLIGDSRILVAEGIGRITSSLRPGLVKLCEDTQTRQPAPEHILRRLVPRLNALGRLGDPTTAWRLLLAEDHAQLPDWLAEAEQAHTTTKALQRRLIGEAEAQVNRLHFRDHMVLVVSRTGWPQGLMGPLASQLSARYGRPAIALALNERRGIGSGRSLPLVNLLDILRACETLLVEFGGHAYACGLTIDVKNVEPFRQLVNQHAERSVGREGLVRARTIDLELPLEEFEPGWIEEAQRLAPFGRGNPKPTVLVRGVTITRRSPRTAWLHTGRTQLAAKGDFVGLEPDGRYDVIASPGVADGEITLLVSDVKASLALSELVPT